MANAKSTTGIRELGEAESQRRSLSDQRFRAAFENAPIGMGLFDEGGRMTDANDAFCAMLGYGHNELAGRSFASITHPDDVAASEAVMTALVTGEQDSAELIKRYIDREGNPVLAGQASQLSGIRPGRCASSWPRSRT